MVAAGCRPLEPRCPRPLHHPYFRVSPAPRYAYARAVATHLHTVFIVEDDDLTRTSLVRRIAESQAGLQVTTAVGSCREIRAALEVTRPAVLLVDLGLPDG